MLFVLVDDFVSIYDLTTFLFQSRLHQTHRAECFAFSKSIQHLPTLDRSKLLSDAEPNLLHLSASTLPDLHSNSVASSTLSDSTSRISSSHTNGGGGGRSGSGIELNQKIQETPISAFLTPPPPLAFESNFISELNPTPPSPQQINFNAKNRVAAGDDASTSPRMVTKLCVSTRHRRLIFYTWVDSDYLETMEVRVGEKVRVF